MSYHRKEVDQFLNHDSTKVNVAFDTGSMDHNSVDVELQFYDVFDPNDNIIAETKIKVEFNEAGELETSSLDMLNQDPEFFEAVLQKKYDRDGEGQKVDFEAGYDGMFMEAVADKVSAEVEHDIKALVNNNQMYFDADEINIEPASNYEVHEVDDNELRYEQDFTITVPSNDIDFEVSIAYQLYTNDEGKITHTSFKNDLGQDINSLEKEKIQDIFINNEDGDYTEFAINEIYKQVGSGIQEYISENEIDEPEKKQKKSKGFGMSM